MSQAQIIEILLLKEKELLKELESITSKETRVKTIWNRALSTEDISLIIGVGIVNTSRAIKRLILQRELQEVRTRKDRRKIRYVTNKVMQE